MYLFIHKDDYNDIVTVAEEDFGRSMFWINTLNKIINTFKYLHTKTVTASAIHKVPPKIHYFRKDL